jgi:prolipoprotein diacylglyceryltransferase
MNPSLFESKFLTIYTLWVFIALGMVISTFIFVKLAQKSRLRLQFISDIITPVLLYGLILGRIFAIINDAQYYFYDFGLAKIYQMIAFWQDKQISFWGAVIGAIYVFIKKAYQKQENLQKWGDIFMISMLVGLTIGNFGAFLDGSNYGRTTSMFWGITFNNPIVKYISAIHPTQIYAMLYCSILAATLYYLHRKYWNQYDGLLFLLGITGFSFLRVIEGFFRGDDVTMIWKFRLVEFCFFFLFLYSLNKLYKFQKKNNVPFLRKFDYYYGKLLNTIKIRRS